MRQDTGCARGFPQLGSDFVSAGQRWWAQDDLDYHKVMALVQKVVEVATLPHWYLERRHGSYLRVEGHRRGGSRS